MVVFLAGGSVGGEFKSLNWQLFFMGLDWINICWKQFGIDPMTPRNSG
jgi:hypothetical protein